MSRQAMKMDELKAECVGKGLPTKGKKADLIARLEIASDGHANVPSSKRERFDAASGEAAVAATEKVAEKTSVKVPKVMKASSESATEIIRSETPRAAALDGLVRAVHWNLGGLNAMLQSKERCALLQKLVAEEQPDLLAISEHKLSEEKVGPLGNELLKLLPSYSAQWAVCTAKKGYSGVVILIKDGIKVLASTIDAIADLHEGRTVTLELDSCFFVATYVPNSGQDLSRLSYRMNTWDPALASHVAELEAKGKPVLLMGDLNVAHLNSDIWNVEAKHIKKSAGTTPQERASFSKLLGVSNTSSSQDDSDATYATTLVDAFRKLHPTAEGCFSYWSVRAGNRPWNRGLRLDYALVSQSIANGKAALQLHDCALLHAYAPNGDHAPIFASLRPTP
mmetsp:Transcript_11110/g.18597  ORF Transcript_11110/g.18597 Transcript_11110/m.18597 type:complete len:395 (-) Transcript_11110:301-1485(-)